jgi:murein DD-endopeptidase MepM/ murein hydrolase activator NlpD
MAGGGATGRLLLVAALVATAACAREAAAAPEPRTVETTTSSTTTTTAPTTTTVPPTTTTAPPSDGTHPPRVVLAQPWVPYATVGSITLHHPSNRVEAIGFHQSGHDGAQAQTALPTSVRWFVQDSRGRDTDRQGAADIVVEPGREIRSPVTGTVVEAGTYALYCDNVDEFVVIEPDARPGWQVKVLHIEGVTVVAGQRVEAGATRLAAHARVLPFPSQVEDDTGLPAWPHVHVEVVDPAVPDRPTGPGCPP